MNTIGRNTIYLYARQLFVVIISLYTSRLVLQTLGVDDYGIYNVVGSVITMFNFLNAGMVQASHRFMAYEVGKGKMSRIREVFSSLLLIHVVIAFVVFIMVEVLGLWFLHTRMNIPTERLGAAEVVLHCSLVIYIIGVLTVPFSATISVHEHFGVPALLGVGDASLKLGGIVVISRQSGDMLILYAIMLLAISLLSNGAIVLYCKKHFKEVSFRPHFIERHLKRILSFAGWSFVGNIGFMGRLSGVNIVINMLCGVAVNASRGIAIQATSQINGFASTFMSAIMPQISKRYARHDYEGMMSLMVNGSKYTFMLLYLLALPFCLRCHYVMELWLGHVPQYAEQFVILIFIVVIIDVLASPLGKAIDATGNIKWFQISMAVVVLLDIPLTYLLLLACNKPYYAALSGIAVSLMAWGVRIIILKRRITTFSFVTYSREVVKCLLAAAVSLLICLVLNGIVPDNLFGLILLCIITVFINFVAFYQIAMNLEEKDIIKDAVCSFFHFR